MIAYLDTNVLFWFAEGELERISSAAQQFVTQAAELLISPIVVLELEYLYEIGRSQLSGRTVALKAKHELGVEVCALSFTAVTQTALDESWTRDPFDRLIVSHAKANGLAPLVSADRKIARNYPRTIW